MFERISSLGETIQNIGIFLSNMGPKIEGFGRLTCAAAVEIERMITGHVTVDTQPTQPGDNNGRTEPGEEGPSEREEL